MARTSLLLPRLPIDDVLAALRAALANRSAAVLQAPPGAGKTTRVPLALLGESWLAPQRIIMLEPRRLAARAAARRMADSLGESVGATVGFRVRGETRIGARTRIEVVTEGVLTRMLHEDAALDGVGLVIFDEFHERSLNADLGLALSLETQSVLRPELRLLVMSATLDGVGIAGLLDDAPVIASEGRTFPIEIRYLPRRVEQQAEGAVASAIRRALTEDGGSVLAFLPGAGEIRRTHAMLTSSALPSDVRVLPLFGAMPPAAQDEAILPAPVGTRKVVLATAIAETSLTIDGVHVVVDSGLARVPAFSPRTGMSRLETVRVSRASAEQRSGRAGRTAPGVCYRLWVAEEQAALLERDRPEILQADLAPLALDLAVAGVVDAASLRWLDRPPAPALAQARELLMQLGALDVAHRITPHGRAIASLGVHPRLAHMMLRGQELGFGATACLIAALLDERDPMRSGTLAPDPDLRHRVAIVEGHDRSSSVDRETVRRVREHARTWRAMLRIPGHASTIESECGRAVALAFPDRVAQRRSGSEERYVLRNGLGALLPEGSSLTGAAYLAIAELGGQRPDARIQLAAALTRADLDELLGDDVQREDLVEWRTADRAIVAVRRERLGAIVLRETTLRDAEPVAVAEALLLALTTEQGLSLTWREDAARLRARLAFLHRHVAGWPDVGDGALRATARDWLLPHLVGLRRREEVQALDLGALLLSRLSWRQRGELDDLAPTHIEVPSGSRIRIDYSDPEAPVLAVRLQELFGLDATPSVAGNTVPLTLHLLSPAHRPVQVTRDLAGFWRNSYFEVRKELRGRYPKHAWPDDPMRAEPTDRTRPRS
ncbi:MAG: ATP-dependent helicase HrpB [Gemmatimonadaceae bacterium]